MNDDSWMEVQIEGDDRTYPQRATPSAYSIALEKGINHATNVLRRALKGQDTDPAISYANPNLESLRKDIIALRRHTGMLVSFVEELCKPDPASNQPLGRTA
jgi:hypothetical protein